jgi:polyhydroxybutyrate depolymerase
MLMYRAGAFAAVAALFAALPTDIVAAGSAGLAALGVTATAGVRQARKPHTPGITEYRITSSGIERRYLMYVPERYDSASALPAVFDFHGSGSDPLEEMEVTGMARAADRLGFLLLMPVALVDSPGGGHTWNVPPEDGAPDDIGFAIDVLEHAAGRVRLDQTRVYAMGFSGGARLASELACVAPERIAAIGAVGGLRAPAKCAGPAVPVVAFHGTGDPINPYAGGGPEYWSYGVEDAVGGWAARNGCTAAPRETRLSEGVVELRYETCRNGAEVVLYRIHGGGHTWPGSSYPFPEERFGRTETGLDATGLMLEFFAGRTTPADIGPGVPAPE